MVPIGFAKRSFARVISLLGVIFLAGIATNWSALLQWKVLGVKEILLVMISEGAVYTFASVPTAVSAILSGGGGFIAGFLMLMFPGLAMFIIVDFAFDIATGVETDAHHLLSFIVAIFLVFMMGVMDIGIGSATFSPGGLDNVTVGNVSNITNVSNASSGVSFL